MRRMNSLIPWSIGLVWALARVAPCAGGESGAEGHEGGVNSAVFIDGGTVLATAGGDGRMLLWEVRTGHFIRSLEPPGKSSIQLATDRAGKVVVAGSKDGLSMFDGKRLSWLSNVPVRSVTVSPDGSLI